MILQRDAQLFLVGQFSRSSIRIICFALLFALAACATTDGEQGPAVSAEKSEPERMFSIVLKNVRNIYIEELPVDSLAIAGLSGLETLEPDIAVERADGRVSLLMNGASVGHVPEPTSNDSDAWGAAMARLVSIGQKSSAKIEAANTEKIYKVTISALLANLDRYSRYAGKLAGRRNRENREGFGGIGVAVTKHDDGVLVQRVTPDFPANRAGVETGDVITAVDGAPLRGLSLRRAIRLLRGPLGKAVQVTVQRESRSEAFVLTISRTRIISVTVHYERRGKFAYLRMTGFNQDTTAELRAGMRRARREIGNGILGLVIDLRGNPGGLLDQAVSAADLFIAKGRISTTRGRHPDSLQIFDASDGDIGAGSPIVVLVNGASASASEVLAAALQDRGRAVLIGANSYGKGTVQTVIRLPNDGELILTWARLYAPTGYVLNRLGVLPILCTSEAENVEGALKRAFTAKLTQRQIAMRRTADSNDGGARETVMALCPWRPQKGKDHEGTDIDIDLAERLLEQPELYQRALRLSAPAAGS